jgi:putative transposase
MLKSHDIEISMNSIGACRDNIGLERPWRIVKYEECCFNAYESLTEARQLAEKYFRFYHQHRKHQTLKAMPDQA